MDFIRHLFKSEGRFLNEQEKWHAIVEEDIMTDLDNSDKLPSEQYTDGWLEAHEIAQHSPRLWRLTQYKNSLPKPYDYGSDRLNAFMELPQNLPEYGEKARESINHVLGEIPKDDKNLAINELAVRIICMRMDERPPVSESYIKETVERLFGVHYECKEAIKKKKKNLN